MLRKIFLGETQNKGFRNLHRRSNHNEQPEQNSSVHGGRVTKLIDSANERYDPLVSLVN